MQKRVSSGSNLEYHAKILLLGDPSVGKTSLLRKFVYGSFTSDYTATLGVDFLTKVINNDNVTVNLAIWDVAGEAKFSSFKSMYYTGASGALLIFDLTRKTTLDNLSTWYADVKKYSPGAVTTVIGNKADLQNQISNDTINEIIKAIIPSYRYFTTSAKTGENVEDVFFYLTDKMLTLTDD
ncbi:MAG: Rab family GTPase [Candidatus Odinarchaeota archaeon]